MQRCSRNQQRTNEMAIDKGMGPMGERCFVRESFQTLPPIAVYAKDVRRGCYGAGARMLWAHNTLESKKKVTSTWYGGERIEGRNWVDWEAKTAGKERGAPTVQDEREQHLQQYAGGDLRQFDSSIFSYHLSYLCVCFSTLRRLFWGFFFRGITY